MPKLFVDLDGVLADFDTHYIATFGEKPPKLAAFDKDGHDVDWSRMQAEAPDFYASLPPMSDAFTLWRFVRQFQPTILTGVPSSVPNAADNKRAWVRRYFGGHVPVICCRSREKCAHAEPGDVLVDDWEKYRDLWERAGGVWVTHTSAERTIARLRELGFRD